MAKQKYYVVWKGHSIGIFNTWQECKINVEGYTGALYKSFDNIEQAKYAFTQKPHQFFLKDKQENNNINIESDIATEGIVVDGACDVSKGIAEYQGVDIKTKQKIFYAGPFEDSTNNIVEFLALVHALAYCKQHNILLPIYSDSITAISWVNNKKTKTLLEPTEKNKLTFELIERALKWLHTNTYPNEIKKWQTEHWGENPADFGRK